MPHLSMEDKQKLFQAVMGEQPPGLGVIGVSGTGKSSALNTTFATKLPVSHTKACTKEFWRLDLKVEARQGELEGMPLRLSVYDAPGLGEDLGKDAEYLEMYREVLPECDIVLYLLHARNRAVALDQFYLEKLAPIAPNLIFGLSQVDLVQPMNWPASLPIPSKEQEKNIEEIVQDRQQLLARVLGYEPKIIPFSAARGYNIETLFTAVLKSAPRGRKWLFDLIKGYRLEDWISEGVTRRAEDSTRRTSDAPSGGRETFELLKTLKAKLAEVFGLRTDAEITHKLGQMTSTEQVDPQSLTVSDLRRIEHRVAQEQAKRATEQWEEQQ